MIAVVGSFNMDLFIEVSRFPVPGEAIHGKNFRRASGGKGANQAYAIARMGRKSAIIGAVGRDLFGDEMLANLRAAGVDISGVVRRGDVASGTAMIVLDAAGQNQIVVANGANNTLTADEVKRHAALFKQSKAVITQLETTLEATAAALRAARQGGAIAVLNPAPFIPVCDELLCLCDWIIPNEGEATKLSGIKVGSIESAAKAARAIKERSQCPNVIVTLGANGVWIDAGSSTGHIPGFCVQALDTVGAGDTFIGAFAVQLAEGADARESARFGCAAAAISVTRRGAQASMPTRAEVERFLRTAR
ncbi:MAG: ribokinase [Verrucomicrobia bacterium]|nr:MAG: ribokinase [Verrucomicrobiota bacterium]